MTSPQLTADDELLPFQDELDRVLHTFNRAMRHADRAHWTGESESGGHDEAWKAKTEAKAAIISWALRIVEEARPAKRVELTPTTTTNLWIHGYNEGLYEFDTALKQRIEKDAH